MLTLAHGTGAAFHAIEPEYCEWCENDGEVNAHTLLSAATRLLAEAKSRANDPLAYEAQAFALMVIDFTENNARPEPAEVTDAEIICWCGHSLHYPNCIDPEGSCHTLQTQPSPLTCASRYKDKL